MRRSIYFSGDKLFLNNSKRVTFQDEISETHI
ncbi:hypothetical protein F383_07527 [Gossypium arboreum]|uniref:Uncharacterized protein n=1 Tax=Gossypium arboreum TaxID=29729 RepID=A0A0B0NVX4_GOSAR|nr:hypothetical protein F383_07527 [Gossypium arboreum]